MNRILYTILGVCLYHISISAQDVIYLEDFSTVPSGTGFPASMVDPVVIGQGLATKGSASLHPTFGRFSVNGTTDQLLTNSIIGEVKWETDPIDISCYANVNFEVQLSGGNTLNATPSGGDAADYAEIDLTLVDLDETYTMFSMAGPFAAFTFTNDFPLLNACGNAIVHEIIISVRFFSDKTFEGHSLNFVKVTGESAALTDLNYTLTCVDEMDKPDLSVTANSGCYPEFSLDGVNYFSSGLFTNRDPGNYTVYVRDHFFQTCTQTSFNVTIPSCGTLLPIELVSFRGQPQHDQIMLQWETKTEINNDYMAVESSADGISFREIGKVKGKGTTQETQYYQFLDRHPQQGVNYYRLRQVDFDGTTTYHPIIAIDLRTAAGTTGQLQLYPTLASTVIQIRLTSKPQQPMPFTIYSLLGQPVLTGVIEKGTDVTEIPIQDLPAASYIFTTHDQGRPYTARFVKQ